MNSRERQRRPALWQAVEGIGLVVFVAGAVWAIAAVIAALVAWMF